MRRKLSRLNVALVLCTLVSALALSGCLGGGGCIPMGDGAIHVTGAVYEWRNAPSDARSQVFVDESPPSDLDLAPLPAANVTLFHGADYGALPIDESTIWKATEYADEQGRFEIQDITSPCPFQAAIRVEKPGYEPVTKVFMHRALNHAAVVLMVRARSSDAQ